jgi:hypothetical protein
MSFNPFFNGPVKGIAICIHIIIKENWLLSPEQQQLISTPLPQQPKKKH